MNDEYNGDFIINLKASGLYATESEILFGVRDYGTLATALGSNHFSMHIQFSETTPGVNINWNGDANWHTYRIIRKGGIVCFTIDGIEIGKQETTKEYKYNQTPIGLFYLNDVRDNTYWFPWHGKVQKFEWYKGKINTFLYDNLKIGD